MLPSPSPATLSNPFTQAPNAKSVANGMLNTYPQIEGYETIQVVQLPCATAQERKRRVYPSFAAPSAPDQTAVNVTFTMGDAC